MRSKLQAKVNNKKKDAAPDKSGQIQLKNGCMPNMHDKQKLNNEKNQLLTKGLIKDADQNSRFQVQSNKNINLSKGLTNSNTHRDLHFLGKNLNDKGDYNQTQNLRDLKFSKDLLPKDLDKKQAFTPMIMKSFNIIHTNLNFITNQRKANSRGPKALNPIKDIGIQNTSPNIEK